MKRTRGLMAVALLFTLMLSGCGNIVQKAWADTTDDESLEMGLAEIYPFRDFPADAYPAKPQAPKNGKVTPTEIETDLFQAKFEGDTVSGSGGAVGGAFHFIASETDGEAWHVKLECNYPTIAGRDYFVTYNFHSDVSGAVKFGDFQEFQIQAGDNSVTGVFTAKDSTSYLDLQLGMLQPFTIDFTKVEVKEYADEVEYEDALPAPVNFERESRVYEKHDEGYSTYLSRASHAVNVNYVSSNLDSGVWKSRLYVKTGMVPEPGTHYRVTADVLSDQDMPFEVLFNDGGVEKGYGALYGRSLTANEVKVVEAVITGNGNGDELILQFSLGEAPEDSMVTVGNVHVDKIKDHYTDALPVGYALDQSVATGAIIDELVPVDYSGNLLNISYSSRDTVYEQHDDGYIVHLKEGAKSAKLDIAKAPAKMDDRGVWKVRLYAATGVKLMPKTNYLVKFDLESEDDQAEYEVCFDGDAENAYGALYGRSLTAGETDHVEQLITPKEGQGPLTVRIQLGKTDTAGGNTVTLKNLSVETVKIKYKNALPSSFSYNTGNKPPAEDDYQSVLPGDFSYNTGVNVSEEHGDGFTQEVTADGSSATLNITSAPDGGGDVWNSKLKIKTGVTPEAGKRYTVRFKIKGSKDQPSYEVCFDGSSENAYYGALYDQSLSAGAEQTVSHSFVAGENGEPLVLRLQLGKVADASGNTITVSDIEIVPVTTKEGASVLPNTFKYPVTTDSSIIDVPESYVAQKVSASAVEVAWDGSQATASGSGTTATLNVTQARGGDGGMWSTRLEANTNVTLEKGVKYRVSGTLTSERALDFEVLYSNGAGTDEGGHNPDGQGYAEGSWGLKADNNGTYFEKVFTVPERSEYRPLVLRVQVGNGPAPNTITLSNIKVEKLVPAHQETVDGTTEESSFSIENNGDASAKLTGDGNSAKATVTTSGDDWHIKFYAKPAVTLEKDKTYQISMNVTGASGCEACYKSSAVEGEKGFGAETISDGTVTHTVKPDKSGTLEILLKIGTVSAGNAVTVSDVKIVEVNETEGDNLMTDKLVAWAPVHEWIDAGYAASLSNTGSSATMAFSSVASDKADWKAKMFVETGAKLKAGKRYRIRYDINADKNFGFNVFYNNGAEEKAVGEFYGMNTSSKTVEHMVTPSKDAVLNIQLMLGETSAPNKVTVSNVQVDEVIGEDGSAGSGTPVNAWVHEDYAAKLSNTSKSASIVITKAPKSGREPWKVKLFAETGAQLKAGKTYRVSIDVNASKALTYDLCYNDQEHEAALGAKYGLSASKTKKTIRQFITPDDDATLILQLGLGNATKGTKVNISNIKVQEVKYTNVKNVTSTFRYDSVGYLSKASDEGYVTTFDQDRSSATFRIKQAPTERHAWNAKIIVKTGITPKAGKGYRVSFTVDAAKEQNLFELFCDGNEELAYGALYEQHLSAGRNPISYTIMPGDSKGELVLQLRFGETNDTSGNTYVVSGFKIEEVTFVNQRRPEIKEVCELATQDGYTATLQKAPDRATVHILRTPPEEELEAWKDKLFCYTGVTFVPGQKYRISMNVKSIVPAPFEVCFNNGDVEKGLGGIFGLTSKAYGEFVEYTTYAKEDTRLVIQLSLGNILAPNTVFLTDVKVEKAGKVDLVSDTVYTF